MGKKSGGSARKKKAEAPPDLGDTVKLFMPGSAPEAAAQAAVATRRPRRKPAAKPAAKPAPAPEPAPEPAPKPAPKAPAPSGNVVESVLSRFAPPPSAPNPVDALRGLVEQRKQLLEEKARLESAVAEASAAAHAAPAAPARGLGGAHAPAPPGGRPVEFGPDGGVREAPPAPSAKPVPPTPPASPAPKPPATPPGKAPPGKAPPGKPPATPSGAPAPKAKPPGGAPPGKPPGGKPPTGGGGGAPPSAPSAPSAPTPPAGGGWSLGRKLGVAALAALGGGIALHLGDRMAREDSQSLMQDALDSVARRNREEDLDETVASVRDSQMRAAIDENLDRLRRYAPDLYASVAAGERLPQGAVVIGGGRRDDLLEQLARRMAEGRFR